MIHSTPEELKNMKWSTLVDVSCDACDKIYQLTKGHLYMNNKWIYTEDGFSKKNSCCKKCQNKIQERKTSHVCKGCGKVFVRQRASNEVYCSRKCVPARPQTKETRKKISQSVKQWIRSNIQKTQPKPKFCVECGKEFFIPRRRTCSIECIHKKAVKSGKVGGKLSAEKKIKRSKAEVKLFDLLSDHYKCIHNKPIFNGWDADIIIPDEKLAIMWNGPWHYTKITKKHSLKQVQSRDFIKIGEILKCGYSFLVVKDHQNGMTPERAANSILECIREKKFNLTLF